MDGLKRLLQPRSIAVIGGGAWCENVVVQCLKMGFDGPIWPVHPKKTEIGGLPTFSDVDALPNAPDACFIGVNRFATVEVVRALNAIGAGGAVCFAAGYLETRAEDADGADLQTALLDAAGDLALLGPNCYGLLNYLDGAALWPDQHGGQRVKSGVAILGQSSNVAVNLTMQRRGLPLAYVVTAGNQAQQSMAEIGIALLEDSRVTALGLHIEGFGDLRAYEALAKRANELGKRIVALKVGRSEQARTATISHTASLAGEDAGAQAFLDRLGIARVDTLGELLESLKLLHVHGSLPGNRVASLSCSGGEASLMADAGQRLHIQFPVLSEPQKKGLRSSLGPLVALANPLDYNSFIWRDRDAMQATFAAMTGPNIDLTIIVIDFPRNDICDLVDWDIAVAAVAGAAKQTGSRFAVLATLPENLSEELARKFMGFGIAPLLGIEEGLTAVRIAARPTAILQAPVLLAKTPTKLGTLSEKRAKSELAKCGVITPRSARAESPDCAAKQASAMGFPVVLKGEGLAHKSDSGAVALNLISAEEVAKAAARINTSSFLIEEMITGDAVELLVGVTLDAAHGYLLTLAAGGVLTEVLNDRQSLLLPTTASAIDKALSALRIAPILAGYRGKPASSRQAIIKAVLAVQTYVIAHQNKVSEVEINPLMCLPDRAVAVDALIRTELSRKGTTP